MQTCALLHVEDEDASACLFRAALSRVGFAASVYRVFNGQEAIQFLKRIGIYKLARRPELILLDLNLPVIDGWTVLFKLQESEDLQKIPVIVLSTSSQPEDRERALSFGATRYITKPFNFEDWVREVESICREFLPQTAETPSTIWTI